MPGALSPNPEARYLQEAAKWYAKYHALAPDDLLGLKKLVEICEELEKAGIEPEALNLQPETLKEELERRTDDKRTVAEGVGLKVDEFELGENLVENGGFEVGDGQPKAWRWAAWVGGKRNEGTFAGGLDESRGYEGDGCLRIKGFWVGREEGKERARVGYWGGRDGLKLKPRTPYVLSFYYKTEGLQGGEANVYSRGGRQVVFGGKGLPRTDGSWRKFAIIGWNALDEPVNLHRFILARNFGVGDVWFDEVKLQEIVLKPGVRIEDTATRFESR